jgi:hypothetical protein
MGRQTLARSLAKSTLQLSLHVNRTSLSNGSCYEGAEFVSWPTFATQTSVFCGVF